MKRKCNVTWLAGWVLLPALVIFGMRVSQTTVAEAAGSMITSKDGLWQYEIIEEGSGETVVAVDEYNGSDRDLVIPEEIDGYVVRYIGNTGGNSIKFNRFDSITISDSVTGLLKRPFFSNNDLEFLHLGKNYGTYSQNGKDFDMLKANDPYDIEPKEYRVSPENEVVTAVDGVLYSKDRTELKIYPSFKEDTAFAVPDGVTSISRYAMDHLQYLESLVLPEGLKEIGEYCCQLASIRSISLPDSLMSLGRGAFSYCYDLKNIVIGSSLASIGEGCFDGLDALETFEISEENQNYKSVEGMLLTKDGSTLLLYTAAGSEEFNPPEGLKVISPKACCGVPFKEIVIPDTVVSIGDEAFKYCNEAKTAYVPSSVKTLGSSVFYGCRSLKKVTIDAQIAAIGSDFKGCDALKEITLPETITSVEDSVFFGDYLYYVYLKSPQAPSISYSTYQQGEDAEEEFIKKSSNVQILVPEDAQGYDVLPWSQMHIVYGDVPDAETPVGLDAEYHTQEEIRKYYQSHPIRNMEAEFLTEPSVTAPYALGELTDETTQDALNMMNLYRYIAGVPEASINKGLQNSAQAAALTCAINRELSHEVTRPNGMDDAMFSQAAFGANNSNLSTWGNVLNNTILGYMLETNGDPDFGHRHQLLDYYNVETGFGMAKSETGGYYSATFVGADFREDKAISYPGQNQPLEYFGTGYAWTVIVPERVDESEINVKLTDMKTGKTWNFSKDSRNLRLRINFDSTCLFFFPNNIDYRDGDQYKVEITGVRKPISYEVHMFLLGDPVPVEKLSCHATTYSVFVGTDDGDCEVEFIPENATNKAVTWTSSDLDIAEPVNTGAGTCRIIAKKVGTAVFTAVSEDGARTVDIIIEVKPRATAIELSTTEATIGVGQTFTLGAKVLPKEADEWAHFKYDYDKNIIDDFFNHYITRITGKAVGKTSVTAYVDSNPDITAACTINVVEPVYTTDLWFDKTEIDLNEGDAIKLEPLYSPANITCRELEWSSDSTCVEVEQGQVKAIYEGRAVITVEALDGSGKKAQCVINVFGKDSLEKDNAKKDISNASVTLSKNICTYNGKAQKPLVVSVRLGNAILKENADYAVNYLNNTDIGTASVTITGKGHYTGTVTKNFSIIAKKGSRFTVGAYKYQITGSSEVAFAGLKSSKTAKVTIPKTVKIGGKAFKVTSVAKNALKKTKVTSVFVGANVTIVGTSAFEGCTQLTKITVGGKATKIGANAFKNCKKLGNITIKSAKLKSVGKNALKGIKATAKIKVPAKKLSAYKRLLKNKGQGKKVKIVK